MSPRQPIMVLGTGSDTGKTTLVMGLCRVFSDLGLRVTPFKSQNMALNSYVTENEEEIARATELQSFAARQIPCVHMNPLLLKPKSDELSQLIVHGKAWRDVSAKEYFQSDTLQSAKWDAIDRSIEYLGDHFDLIVAEGAGSCAEPNLRTNDVVNMGLAHRLDAKVLLVADIDKGGVFAEFLGSLKVLELIEPADIPRIAGFLINKFRGDRDVLQPAIDFLEEQTGIPVVGVIPYLDLDLEEEDRVRIRKCPDAEIDIAVVYLPHIANANDLDFLASEEKVRVRFIRSPDQLGMPDAVILPGTKNTIADLERLRESGLAQALTELASTTPLVGICGGYQMLGRRLIDDDRLESHHGSVEGLGLLDVDVEFLPQKIVRQKRFTPTEENPLKEAGEVKGYEIHAGIVHYLGAQPLYRHREGFDGAVHPHFPVMGTFIHDLFKNPQISRAFINQLRERKGLAPLAGPLLDHEARRNHDIDRLASALREHLSLEKLGVNP